MSNFYETDYWAGWGIGSAARILAVAWAIGWIAFGMVTGVGEGLEVGEIIAHIFVPGFIILVTAVVAFRWEGLGGLLLLGEGMFLSAYYVFPLGGTSLIEVVFVALSSTLPALLVGLLFIASWRRSRGYRLSRRPVSDAA